MKIIKIFYYCTITTFLFTTSHSIAQSMSIADPVVALQKIGVGTLIATNSFFKDSQKGKIKELIKLEKEYQEKIKNNVNVSVFAGTILTTVEVASNNIDEIKMDIKKLNSKLIYLKHGLSRVEENLLLEERYLKEIKDDYEIFRINFLLAGGIGYNYTFFIKLLTRVIAINNKVLALRNKVDNLLTFNSVMLKIN